MSAVRMCDRCGRIFPEGEDGSAVVQGVRNERDDKGRPVQRHVQEDICMMHSNLTVPQPRLALEGPELAAAVDKVLGKVRPAERAQDGLGAVPTDPGQ